MLCDLEALESEVLCKQRIVTPDPQRPFLVSLQPSYPHGAARALLAHNGTPNVTDLATCAGRCALISLQDHARRFTCSCGASLAGCTPGQAGESCCRQVALSWQGNARRQLAFQGLRHCCLQALLLRAMGPPPAGRQQVCQASLL